MNVPISYLLNELDENTALRVLEILQGCRIYFPAKKVMYYKIKKDYEKMSGTEKQKIEQLSFSFELSKVRIKEILRIKDNIFDDVE